MAQEFTINSSAIEAKINSLLPSQGNAGAGVDFSASTMIIPIIDLTEAASGAGLRQDLQTCASLSSVTTYDRTNNSSVVLNTTGYYRFKGHVVGSSTASTTQYAIISITDGTTTKILQKFGTTAFALTQCPSIPYDFIVKLEAGDSITVLSNSSSINIHGWLRQIADLSGNLVNP